MFLFIWNCGVTSGATQSSQQRQTKSIRTIPTAYFRFTGHHVDFRLSVDVGQWWQYGWHRVLSKSWRLPTEFIWCLKPVLRYSVRPAYKSPSWFSVVVRCRAVLAVSLVARGGKTSCWRHNFFFYLNPFIKYECRTFPLHFPEKQKSRGGIMSGGMSIAQHKIQRTSGLHATISSSSRPTSGSVDSVSSELGMIEKVELTAVISRLLLLLNWYYAILLFNGHVCGHIEFWKC